MFTCHGCSPDEVVPLQLAANARGVIEGVLLLALLLVVAVALEGACLKYTRRLLLAGALLVGAGLGTLVTGVTLQHVLPLVGIAPSQTFSTIALRGEWLWRGDFYLYGCAAIVLGGMVAVTEARNLKACMRNGLLPSGILVGWGLLEIAASIYVGQTFDWSRANPGINGGAWLLALATLGVVMTAAGSAWVVAVMKHHKLAPVQHSRKRVAHAHS